METDQMAAYASNHANDDYRIEQDAYLRRHFSAPTKTLQEKFIDALGHQGKFVHVEVLDDVDIRDLREYAASIELLKTDDDKQNAATAIFRECVWPELSEKNKVIVKFVKNNREELPASFFSYAVLKSVSCQELTLATDSKASISTSIASYFKWKERMR